MRLPIFGLVMMLLLVVGILLVGGVGAVVRRLPGGTGGSGSATTVRTSADLASELVRLFGPDVRVVRRTGQLECGKEYDYYVVLPQGGCGQ